MVRLGLEFRPFPVEVRAGRRLPGRSWARRAAVACALLACACDVYEARLRSSVAVEPDASTPGSRSDAASADAASADASADEALCTPELARMRDGCRPGCGDPCNGRDDDCDGTADESSADASCEAPNATAVCRQGRCLLTGCQDDYRDCDQLPDNGCEVAPDDPLNCGACGHVCEAANAEPTCREDRCELTSCRAGYADCDGDGTSCETALDSPTDCGACGNVCPAGAHATARCSEGACTEPRCDPGYADCNGDPNDGCEQTLDTLDHCGGCGVRCDKATCNGGVCTAADCSLTPGSADCDGDAARCETDLRTDVDHCGSCGAACRLSSETPHAHARCQRSRCISVCDRGWANCDEDPANGCERSLHTLSDCGSCGRACAIPDATERCEDSRCLVAECNAGFADCDGDRLSCETKLDTTENCGVCGLRCALPNALETCAGAAGERRCALTGCEPNWADCDGLAANGCERDLRAPTAGGEGPCLPEPNCRHATRNGRVYFVCPTQRAWQAARAHCQSQRGGDLAVISSTDEATFVASMLTTRTWIGHSDLNSEGLWIWARTGVPFWRGQTRGAPINAVYSRWASGEPNGSGDCGALYESGFFDDHVCSATQPYVCEVAPDACPLDPNKWDPGQCGCGRQDIDRTGDGLADCGE